MAERRSGTGAPWAGFGARPPAPVRRPLGGAVSRGSKGGAASPLPARSVQHCVGWLPPVRPTHPASGRTPLAAFGSAAPDSSRHTLSAGDIFWAPGASGEIRQASSPGGRRFREVQAPNGGTRFPNDAVHA